MPGIFSKENRPVRPGAYFNFEPGDVSRIEPGSGSIVALAITHPWGPFETVETCLSYSEFLAKYGNYASKGRNAVKMAFLGEGLPGTTGAAAVRVYRHGGSAAAKATRTLMNTAGTPANALTITARWQGTKGNDLRVSIENNAAVPAEDVLIVKDGTTEVERYVYDDADLASLAADVNDSSEWVTATVVADGTSLAVVTDQALSGGNDGTTFAGADMTAALQAIEPQRFGLFAWQDLAGETYSGTTADAVLTSTLEWAVGDADTVGLNSKGRRFMTVVGGELNETFSTGFTRSASINHPDVMNIAGGSVTDSEIVADEDTVLSSSQLAPRVAGILAGRGEAQSATFARLAGVELTVGPTEAEVLSAFSTGTVVLSKDSTAAAPVRIEKALTTFTTKNDDNRPYLIFRNPKFVRTMHGLETELTEFAEANVIGKLPVNDDTREFLVGEMLVRINARVERTIIQPGATVAIDQDPPPSDDDEFIQLVYGIKFGRSIEQVFNTVRVG